MDKRMKDAHDFLYRAGEEFQAARGNGDEIAIRQAAEKGWGAVLQATKSLLKRRGFKAHRGTRAIEASLRELERSDAKVSRANLLNDFRAYMLGLHVSCFGEGDYSVKTVDRDLRRIERYISNAERL